MGTALLLRSSSQKGIEYGRRSTSRGYTRCWLWNWEAALLRKAHERWPEARLIGVDAAEGMIEKARELTPGAIFYVGKAESLPLADASIDIVFSTFSYHHWSDKLEGLRQIARILRLSGRLFLADATMPFGLSLFIHHFQENTPAKLLSMFASAGLEVQAQKRMMTRFIIVTVGKRP